MSSGYLKPEEVKATKPIKATPSLFGFENQRAIILMRSNGQPLGSYLWSSLVANSSKEGNQEIIERTIAQEIQVLKRLSLPHTYVDAARSLLVGSGIYELTELGFLIPTPSGIKLYDSTLDS